MAVRSRRFSGPDLLVPPAVWANFYTVPAARTAVFRAIVVANVSAVAAVFEVQVGSAVAPVQPTEKFTLAAGATHTLRDWVGNPGDRLQGRSSVASAMVLSAFGSLLDGAPS